MLDGERDSLIFLLRLDFFKLSNNRAKKLITNFQVSMFTLAVVFPCARLDSHVGESYG